MADQRLLNGLIGQWVFIEDEVEVHSGHLTAALVRNGTFEFELLDFSKGRATQTLIYRPGNGPGLHGVVDVTRKLEDHRKSVQVVGQTPFYFNARTPKAEQLMAGLDLSQVVSGWAFVTTGSTSEIQVFEGLATYNPNTGQLSIQHRGWTTIVDPQLILQIYGTHKN